MALFQKPASAPPPAPEDARIMALLADIQKLLAESAEVPNRKAALTDERDAKIQAGAPDSVIDAIDAQINRLDRIEPRNKVLIEGIRRQIAELREAKTARIRAERMAALMPKYIEAADLLRRYTSLAQEIIVERQRWSDSVPALPALPVLGLLDQGSGGSYRPMRTVSGLIAACERWKAEQAAKAKAK